MILCCVRNSRIFYHLIATTVRLLTHVLCESTHFYFHSFIATMSYSLQTNFSSVMKDWADRYHVWGSPHEVTFKVKLAIIHTRVLHTKKEHIYMCSYMIPVVYICPIISCLKGFASFYHIPHQYGMHM